MSQTRHMPAGPSSRSQLQTIPQTSRGGSSTIQIPGTLRLRGEHNADTPETTNQEGRSTRRIKWSEDVIDNEGMGKKSSKVCCIYHKPRPVGESSSESESDSSDSDSDSDSECDGGPGHGHSRSRGRNQNHNHRPVDGESLPGPGSGPAGEQSLRRDGGGRRHATGRKQKQREPSPNAYEKMPKSARR